VAIDHKLSLSAGGYERTAGVQYWNWRCPPGNVVSSERCGSGADWARMGGPGGGSDELDSLGLNFYSPLRHRNHLLLPGQSVCIIEPTEPKDFLDSIGCRTLDNGLELRSRPWAVAIHAPKFVGGGAEEFNSSLGNLRNHLDFADRADPPGPLNGLITVYL
jgi:hypothetical protein